jgi:hypothetical protein
MAYKPNELHQDEPDCTVLIIELLQFYYSMSARTQALVSSAITGSECHRLF